MSDQPDVQMPRILDFNRLSMWTPTPGVENKRARLSFGMLDVNPRITIFTNNPEDKVNKGVLSAAMNPETFMMFLNRFEAITRGPADKKEKIPCYQGKERVKVSDLIFGKDADGFCWLSVVAPNRPNIKFTFKMSDWHELQLADGTKFSETDCSVLEAQAKIQILRTIYGQYFAEVMKTPKPDYGTIRDVEKTAKKTDGGLDMTFEDIQF